MNEVTTLDFEGNAVRVSRTASGELRWVLADVCAACGISNPRDVMRRLDDDQKGVDTIDTLGGPQKINVITESGLYDVILDSRKPEARRFRKWITSEVLPSIREHGGYLAGQERMSPEEMIAASMRYLESKIAEQKRQLDAQRPKVALADAVRNSTSTILIGELAKILTQNGANGLGTRRLFARLRADGYLCRQRGEMWNLPTQCAMDMGLFQVVKRPVEMPDGTVRVTRTTKVTGKGQQYFINRYIHHDKEA